MLQAKNTQSGSTSSKVTGGYAKGCFLKGPKREREREREREKETSSAECREKEF
jgi:hypothetical protein